MKGRRRVWAVETWVGFFWLIPFLVPYAFGLWALWSREWFSLWLLSMAVVSGGVYVAARLLERRDTGVEAPATPPDAAEAEARAREALRRMMAAAGPADVASPKAVEGLIREVLRVVAEAWYPGKRRAELRFTLPEALALAERLARRLRLSLEEDVPALRYVRISHVVGARRHVRPALAVWNVYRAGRFAVNPVGAVVAEVRRGAMRSLTPAVLASVRGKAAALLVRETGEAAICLYSSRLRFPEDETEEAATGPCRVFVTGQPGAGKSSVIRCLSEKDGEGVVEWEESEGLGPKPGSAWMRRMKNADAILWVMAAHRADRAPDARAMEALSARFRERSRERPPPVVGVVTHVDRLAPAREWEPPYEVETGERHKEQSIRAALGAVARALGVEEKRVAPAMCEAPEDAWNLDAVWGAVLEVLPAARRVRRDRLARETPVGQGLGDVARTFPGLARAAGREWDKREGGTKPTAKTEKSTPTDCADGHG